MVPYLTTTYPVTTLISSQGNGFRVNPLAGFILGMNINTKTLSRTPFHRWKLAGLVLLLSGSLGFGRAVTGTVVSLPASAFELSVQLEGAEAPQVVLVGSGDRAIAQPGDRFRGDLVRQGDQWRLENVFPADPVAAATIEKIGDDLRRETLRRGRKAFRLVGERAPRFALWDQRGELFQSETLRGHYYVMNFVFTRCTMPNMCPASTTRMIELATMVDERGWDDVRFVSVTLDPAYDTPGIWTSYAASRGIDGERHFLLGGPAGIIDDLKKQMGILAELDADLIVKHTMSTALVDPTGRIIYRLPGSLWSPEVFVQQIAKARNTED